MLRHCLSLPRALGTYLAALALAVYAARPADAQIPPPTYSVLVTPKGGTPISWGEGTTGHQQTFTVKNTGNQDDVFSLACKSLGPITCTSMDSSTVLLAAGQSKPVVATYSVGGQGSGVIKVTALGDAGDSDYGYVNVTAVRPAGAPIVDASPYNFDDQSYSRCTNTCFAATTARGTVPYFSLDVPRQVTLVYNGDRVNPRPFVLLNVTPDTTYGTWPTRYQLQVKVNGAFVRFVNGEDTLNFTYNHATMGTAPYRIGGQFDASTYATNAYAMDIYVSAVFSNMVVTNDVWAKLVVVNENTSPIARGWSIGSIQRLYPQADGSALVVEGDASAVYFASTVSGFASPSGDFSKLIPSSLSGSSGWARVYPDSTKVVFNSSGLMTQIRDRFSNMVKVYYDASNRAVKVVDPVNLQDTLTYTNTGLNTIKDAGGRITTVTVDTAGRLTVVKDPDNDTTRYSYDALKRLSTITDRRQSSTRLGYDSLSGTVDSIIAPSVTLFDNTQASPVSVLTAWQPVGVPYGPTTSTPFTPVPRDSVRAVVTEPGGATTRFSVNRWGTAAQIINALSQVMTTSFDANGLPVKTVHATGAIDTTSYDTNGLPVFVRSANDSGVHMRYAAWAQPDSVWGAGRATVRPYIGTNGRVDSTRLAGAAVTRFTYDSAGRLRSITDALGNLTQMRTYGTPFGSTSKDSLGNGLTIQYYYDQYGRDTAVHRSGLPTSRVHYDLVNRPVEQYDGVHASPVRFSYDGALDTAVTDVGGQVYKFAYNALGWLTTRMDPTGHSDVYGFSRDGDLMRWTNRRAQTMSYAYDLLHREASDSGPNRPAEHWNYSSDGRSVASSGPVSTETTYMGLGGRPDSVSTVLAGQTFWRRYHYTVSGLLDSVAVTGGGVPFRTRVYVYDSTTWQLKTARLGAVGTPTTTIVRNADMADTLHTLPGGDAVSKQYDPILHPATVSTAAAYSGSVNRQAVYDPLGRLVLQVLGDGASGVKYEYDGLGQVQDDSAVTAPPGNTCSGHAIIGPDGSDCAAGLTWTARSGVTFAYDSLGNRTDNSGLYTTGNRIRSFAGCSYGTDADGNVTGRTCGSQSVAFKWTPDSRLDTLVVGSATVGYWYDAAGRVVRKDVGGTPQSYFLWDGQNLLAELNGAGTGEVAEYSYNGVDDPHALVVAGHAYFAHEDMIGSVVALTDSAKQLQRSFAFDAWGSLSTGNDYLPFNNADRARWKGALWLGPEVDLYYMRNRWYEPLTGRFLSEDPDGLRGGFNLYTYGFNDPVNMRDPNGLCPEGTHPTGRIKLIKGVVYEECVDGNGATSWSPQTVQLPPVSVPANPPPPIAMPQPPAIADPSMPAPVVGVGVPGSPAPTPATGTQPPNKCSLSSFFAAAKTGARVVSQVGMYYGAVVGSVAGFTGGAVTGSAVGTLIGAPTGIGAIAGAVGGFVGGGLEGAYWGGIAGTASGFVIGGALGFTSGFVGGIVVGCLGG